MVTPKQARDDFDELLEINSQPIRFKYFDESGASTGYDDDVSLTQSGSDVWTSGLTMPVGNSKFGSAAWQLVEQGRIRTEDKVIYLPCDVTVSGRFRVGIGSPSSSGAEFQKAIEGVYPHDINGEVIYQKIFVTRLQYGKLHKEV